MSSELPNLQYVRLLRVTLKLDEMIVRKVQKWFVLSIWRSFTPDYTKMQRRFQRMDGKCYSTTIKQRCRHWYPYAVSKRIWFVLQKLSEWLADSHSNAPGHLAGCWQGLSHMKGKGVCYFGLQKSGMEDKTISLTDRNWVTNRILSVYEWGNQEKHLK